MSHDVSVRTATQADLRAVVDLAIALGRQHEAYDPARFQLSSFGADPAALVAVYERFFSDVLEDPGAILLVAVAGEGVVGYAFSRLEPESFLDLCEASGWIHDLFVCDAARGRGIGAALLSEAIAALRSRGARSLLLSVSPKNAAARALFERAGFVATMIEHRLRDDASPRAARAPRLAAARHVRRVSADDIPALERTIDGTGLFPSSLLAPMIAPHLAGDAPDELWLTYDDGEPSAVAYCAPERMTQGAWNLLLMAVHPDRQSRGQGNVLLSHLEDVLREKGQRILLVETSGLPEFERTRAFYARAGYETVARIPEFYQAGEDKIVFRKALRLR